MELDLKGKKISLTKTKDIFIIKDNKYLLVEQIIDNTTPYLFNLCSDIKREATSRKGRVISLEKIELLYNDLVLKLREKTTLTENEKKTPVENILNNLKENTTTNFMNTDKIKEVIDKLFNFFKEFDYTPSFRFINTLNKSNNKIDYIENYFKLSDNANYESITEKLNSIEFKKIINDFNKIKSEKEINKRLVIYYGSQGCGKTTQALKESNNNVIVCNSSMLPQDLLQDFDFQDGKATFKKSVLWECMENGKPITFDEFNLLNFESVRFLQGLLDNKESINFKGQTIKIKDGFKIIATMNLQVNGQTFALPEPLIDRAKELKEFKITSDMLLGALI